MSKTALLYGLTLLNNKNEEVTDINKINEDEKYSYIVGESLFEELKKNFLEFLKEINYEPSEASLEEMATQIASHYVVCIENEPDKSYIDTITSFNSIKESTKWFWEQVVEELEEYDIEI